MRTRVALLILVFAGLVLEGRSQTGSHNLRFRRIQANSKLSNSNVTAILQDSFGFLWVGTDDGLNRFDGYEFRIYRNIENDSASLLRNKVQSVFEDSKGRLWVSTLNSGLHLYDRSRDAFVRVAEFSFSHCQVMRIIEDRLHDVWIGGVLNSQAFVARLDNESGRWTKFMLFPSTDPVYSMLQQSDDEFWLGTRQHGLFKWNQRTRALEHFENKPGQLNGLPGNYIERMLKDDQGNIWIATRSGLSKLDKSLNHYTNYKAGQGSIPVNDIMDICMDGDRLWIATENGGLSRMDLRSGVFTNFFYDKNDENSIINNSIWSLHKDRQGRIWIGSYAKGLCVYDKIQEKFNEVSLPIENDLVNSVLKDSRGRLWVGTESGLLLLDGTSTRHFKNDPKDPFSLSSNAVNCIYEDSRHRIWTGHWNGGINRFDEKSERFVRYGPDPRHADCLSNPNVFSIAESSITGELLVCTFNGLYILKDESHGVFENVVELRHEGDQLLLTVLEDRNKNIWIGSYSGLSKFSMKGKTYKRLYVTNDTTDVSDRINCILEDRRGRLWIGSYAGLHQMVDEGHFITYTTRDGLPVNIVQGILEDRQGMLWLGTTHGLCRFNPDTRSIETFDESDGLQTSEFRKKAFFRSDDGQLFVGGKGLNSFYPDSLSTNPNRPPVFITDLKIFNRSIVPNDKDGILDHSISETKEIYLNHTLTVFSIHYVGINFTAGYKNKYAYRLEGFDSRWNYVGDQRFATFTNLDPGTYTFHVKAANNDGLWNETGASLIIHILPPWWKTLWFRLVTIGFAAAIITAIYYFRMQGVRKQNLKLEDLVKLRTRELQDTNRALGMREKEIVASNQELIQRQKELSTQRDLLSQQNKKLADASRTIELKNLEIILHNENLEQEVAKRTKELLEHNHQLEQFAFISAHNLRAPVARILGLGEILKIAKTPDEEQMILEKLVVTTRELDGVVKDLNKILDIRKNNSSVITRINLTDELEMVRVNLEKEIQETGAEILEDFSEVDVIQSVKPYIDSILLNLVSNAIKYRHPSRPPVISVAAQKQGEFVRITVSDNGLGINLPKYEDKLFKLYNRFHSHVEGKGMGLYLVKTQVAALGGRIEVASEVDKGMVFTIYLHAKMEALVLS